MAYVPETELALLRQCAPRLLNAVTVEQEALPEPLRDPDWFSFKEPWSAKSVKGHKDFTSDQALVALAVSRVSATVRAIKHQTDPAMNRIFGLPPDLLVTASSSAWLGKGVGMATGIDAMVFVDRNGRSESPSSQAKLFANRKRLLVIGSVFGIEADVAVVRNAPDVVCRCIGVITLMDGRTPDNWKHLDTPMHAVLGSLFSSVTVT